MKIKFIKFILLFLGVFCIISTSFGVSVETNIETAIETPINLQPEPLKEEILEEQNVPNYFEIYIEETKEIEGEESINLNLEDSQYLKYSIKTTQSKIDDLNIPHAKLKAPYTITTSYPSIRYNASLDNTFYKSRYFKNLEFGSKIKYNNDVNSYYNTSDLYLKYRHKKYEIDGILGNYQEIKHFGTTVTRNTLAVANKYHLTDNFNVNAKFSQATEQSWNRVELGVQFKPKSKPYSLELNTSSTNEYGYTKPREKFSFFMNYEF